MSKLIKVRLILKRGTHMSKLIKVFFFFEEVKLVYLNWHRRKSNMRLRGGAHSHTSSQYHRTNNQSGITNLLKLRDQL